VTIDLPPDYEPNADEEYMNPRQLEYFRRRLMEWRDTLLAEDQETLNSLRNGDGREVGDEADIASRETDQALELRTRDRHRKLIRKIEDALGRIAEGSYGYCEETGEEIGIARLKVRPVATLSVEAQERREMKERSEGPLA
jgi:DnaK suppressor protein